MAPAKIKPNLSDISLFMPTSIPDHIPIAEHVGELMSADLKAQRAKGNPVIDLYDSTDPFPIIYWRRRVESDGVAVPAFVIVHLTAVDFLQAVQSGSLEELSAKILSTLPPADRWHLTLAVTHTREYFSAKQQKSVRNWQEEQGTDYKTKQRLPSSLKGVDLDRLNVDQDRVDNALISLRFDCKNVHVVFIDKADKYSLIENYAHLVYTMTFTLAKRAEQVATAADPWYYLTLLPTENKEAGGRELWISMLMRVRYSHVVWAAAAAHLTIPSAVTTGAFGFQLPGISSSSRTLANSVASEFPTPLDLYQAASADAERTRNRLAELKYKQNAGAIAHEERVGHAVAGRLVRFVLANDRSAQIVDAETDG